MFFPNLQHFHQNQISCVNPPTNDLQIDQFVSSVTNEAQCVYVRDVRLTSQCWMRLSSHWQVLLKKEQSQGI